MSRFRFTKSDINIKKCSSVRRILLNFITLGSAQSRLFESLGYIRTVNKRHLVIELFKQIYLKSNAPSGLRKKMNILYMVAAIT